MAVERVDRLAVGDVIRVPNVRAYIAPIVGVVTSLLVRQGVDVVIRIDPTREYGMCNYQPQVYLPASYPVEILESAA